MDGLSGQALGIEAVAHGYAFVSVIAGLWFLLLSSSNALFFRFSRRPARLHDGALLSVLVPARNEEQRIRPTLDALIHQTYSQYEVIVIDDNSTDGTWDVIQEYADRYPQFTALRGKPLPDGWKGKPYAMEQLAGKARGDVFVFVDADMTPTSDFLSWVAERMRHHRADSLSAYARHWPRNFLENILFAAVYTVNMTILPFWLINFTHFPLFSHAIGQVIVFRRKAFEGAGGCERVRDQILEDIMLARNMKASGFRHIFLDARKVLSGYMYDSLDHILSGLKRVIYVYFDKKLYPLIVMSIFLALFMVFPPFMIGVSWVLGWISASMFVWASVLLLAAWAVCLYDRRQLWYVPLFYPVTFSVLIVLGWISWYEDVLGKGYAWKGRIIR